LICRLTYLGHEIGLLCSHLLYVSGNVFRFAAVYLFSVLILENKEVVFKIKKEEQAPSIAPLQPSAFAAFRPWRIGQELVVKDLPFGARK